MVLHPVGANAASSLRAPASSRAADPRRASPAPPRRAGFAHYKGIGGSRTAAQPRRRARLDVQGVAGARPASSPGPAQGGRMRIIFMGTPEFAVPTLEALLAAGETVALVVTQPDRPVGRGRRLA